MAGIFKDIQAERAALLELIGGLDAATIERPHLLGSWSIKDMLAHLAGWQTWMAKVYPYRLDHGEMPADMRVTPDGIDEWNRRFVEQYREQPAAKVLAELAEGQRSLLLFAVNLGATRLAAPDPWPDSDSSIEGYLRRFQVEHDHQHRRQVEQALEALE